MNYKSFADLHEDIRKNIGKIKADDFDLIVGIPRSGIIPAYTIALLLNKNCTDIRCLVKNEPLVKGKTRQIVHDFELPSEAKKILLVDDSIRSGQSLKDELEKLPTNLKNKITTLAIYSSLKHRDDVDIFLEYLSMPRVFEWNIYHHSIIKNSCVDIDGILCIDPTEEENDDGDKYRFFLLNAKPLFLPSGKIHTLVTNRLEKYRAETEKWLQIYGVKYESLIMLDLPSKEERLRLKIHSKHKAECYLKSGLNLFIESNQIQAEEIHRLTKKPVYCAESNKIYAAGPIFKFELKQEHKVHRCIKLLRRRLPEKYKNVFKKYIWFKL